MRLDWVQGGGMFIDGAQIRAARALLNWSSAETAAKAGIARQTLYRLETYDDRPPSRSATLGELARIFVEGGVEFIDADGEKGPGVRLARPLRE